MSQSKATRQMNHENWQRKEERDRKRKERELRYYQMGVGNIAKEDRDHQS